jgi:hypothetical protein
MLRMARVSKDGRAAHPPSLLRNFGATSIGLPSRSPQGEGWFETAPKKRLLTMRFVCGSARRHHRYHNVLATAADAVDLTIDSLLLGGRLDTTVWRAGSARLTVWWQRYEIMVVPRM